VEWVVSAFSACGITYEHSEESKSELYGSLLPMLNSGTVALLTNDRLRRQLLSLERRTGRGRDIIDHPRNGHDDVANAVAGALVLAKLEPGSTPIPGFEAGARINYFETGYA
jgi:streptomycin 6-kinase